MIMVRVSKGCGFVLNRRVFALREKEGEGGGREWERSELCMGDSTVCTDGLVGAERERHILSFGEDEDGELYILTTSYASPTDRGGVVYHLVDPSRYIHYTLWDAMYIVLKSLKS